MSKQDHIFLVDGSSYIFRAYHALPPLTREDGTPVNAVYGFCTMLMKLLEDTNEHEDPTHIAVIFDAGRRSFRNDIYEDYKANRPDPPEDLVPQFPLIRDAVRAFNVPSIEMEGYEADDIIATYVDQARKAGAKVTIISSDKDLMQLVGDDVDMLDTMKNRRMGVEAVIEKFGLGPDKVVEIQALAGDSTDNVPGVPGIGVKTAAQLIDEYGDLETLLARAEEIKQNKRRENLIEFAEQARVSKQLVTLRPDVPIGESLDDLKTRDLDAEALVAFLGQQNFRTLVSKVAARHGEDLDDEAEDHPALDEADYVTIARASELDEWIEEAYAAGRIAVDTETTSLNPAFAKLVGIALSTRPGRACYVPVGHVGSGGEGTLDLDGSAPDQPALEDVIAKLKPLLEDPGVLKIGQNLKYDIFVLRRHGIDLSPYDDTMLLSYALESGLHGHGMDELSQLHLGHTPISYKEVTGSGKKAVTFDRVAIEDATPYAAEDADVTLRLREILKPRLVPEHVTTVYEMLDRPLAAVLARMEEWGVKVDRDMLKVLSTEFAGNMERLEGEIHKLAGHEFNIGSPKQLGEVLFEEMGLKGGKTGKSGAKSTSADVLEGLAADGHELPARVLEWRQMSKLRSTYTDALQEDIHPETGRVHTSYSLAGTSTGRLASSDPNLQNIPIRTPEGRRIREAFVPEDGFTLLSADYSQIELRILAHMANIEALREAFAEGQDIHAMTASEVFGIPIEGMDPADRRRAKAINFGIIYGISAFGLGRQLSIPQTEAQDYIDRYFERFPGIRAYMEETREFARENGYVKTLFGRKCHTGSIKDKNPARRQFAERAAINAPIQGSAADIIRKAMIRMPGALEDRGLGARMLLQVHDELIFEVPENELDETKALVCEVMEGAPGPSLNLSVPLDVDAGSGKNWDEAH